MKRTDRINYVADMSAQLASLCRDMLPLVSRLLDIAADLAKEAARKKSP